MNRRTALILGAVFVALIGVIGLTVYLLQSQQDVRSRAQSEITPTPSQSCPTPAQVQNVLVEFPNCVGDICNFTEASCSWNSVAEATKYQLTVSQVESGSVVKNEQVEAAITRVVFPVTQNKTYKCDVSAINSCGTSGAAGSHSLLCEVDAIVATPRPTPTPIPPTSTPIPPTQTPLLSNTPTSSPPTPVSTIPVTSAPTPVPTLPPPGENGNLMTFVLTTTLLLILGVALLAL